MKKLKLAFQIATPDPKKRQELLKDYDRMALPNFGVGKESEDSSFVTVTISSLTLTHFDIVSFIIFHNRYGIAESKMYKIILKIIFVQNEEDQTFELEAWPSFVSCLFLKV